MLKNLSLSILTSTALFFTACSSSDSEETKSVSVDFSAKSANKLISCTNDTNQINSYNLGSTNNASSIVDFRFYISEVYLLTKDGQKEKIILDKNDFQYSGEEGSVALLDFEDNTGNCKDRGNTSALNKSITGKIKDNDYTQIEFTLGVPFDLNHIEPNKEEANKDFVLLTQPGMPWNWQSGKKFTKLEFNPNSNNLSRWNFHLGSTACTYNNDTDKDKITQCAQENRVKIKLDFDYKTQNVLLNLNDILANTDISVDAGGAPGCMGSISDPECLEVFPKLAIDTSAKNGLCINGNDCSTQELFTVETK